MSDISRQAGKLTGGAVDFGLIGVDEVQDGEPNQACAEKEPIS